jgi:hypothetical protein
MQIKEFRLEEFLWHPHSATYQPRTDDFKMNDTLMYLGDPLMYFVAPPRSLQYMPLHFNLSEIVHRWAYDMGLHVRIYNHIVISQHSRDLLLVDYILESQLDRNTLALLSIEYNVDDQAHPPQDMATYMSLIMSTCLATMGRSPKAYILTLSGVQTPHVSVKECHLPKASFQNFPGRNMKPV